MRFLIESEIMASLSVPLEEVNLSGANLSLANLSWANLSGADLEGIKWNVKTQWPNRSLFEGVNSVPDALKKELGL